MSVVRMIFRTSKLAPLLAALGLVILPARITAASDSDSQQSTERDAQPELSAGTKLVATGDVKVRRVQIAKGSRLLVTNVARRAGRIASVDVELPDGYVLRSVGIRTILALFRVVSDTQ